MKSTNRPSNPKNSMRNHRIYSGFRNLRKMEYSQYAIYRTVSDTKGAIQFEAKEKSHSTRAKWLLYAYEFGAEGESRTLTRLPSPNFESGASTSSATSASSLSIRESFGHGYVSRVELCCSLPIKDPNIHYSLRDASENHRNVTDGIRNHTAHHAIYRRHKLAPAHRLSGRTRFLQAPY